MGSLKAAPHPPGSEGRAEEERPGALVVQTREAGAGAVGQPWGGPGLRSREAQGGSPGSMLCTFGEEVGLKKQLLRLISSRAQKRGCPGVQGTACLP